MRRNVVLLAGIILVLLQDSAQAYDRYTVGRRLFRRRCGVCLSMGWVWAPKKLPDGQVPNLVKMASTWSAAQVCTWMHRETRKVLPPGCYPGRIRYREKLDILYYLYHRSLGPITKPVLRAMPFRFAKVHIKPVTPARRRTALQRYKAAKALRRWMHRVRRWGGRWTGNMTGKGPKKRGQAAKPRPSEKAARRVRP